MPPVTHDHLVLSATLRATPGALGQSVAHIRGGQISVRVSTTQAEDVLTVLHDYGVLLVRLDKGDAEINVLQPAGGVVAAIMRSEGEVSSLDRGSYTLSVPHEGATLIKLEISKASFGAFCKLHCNEPIHSFSIPNVVCDSTLHLLSRTIRPLIAERSVTSATFDEYFVLSLFSHLAETYGVERSLAETAMGGLSPKNRRLVERQLRESSTLEISAESLAAACNLSSRHFARAFLQSFGMPFHRFHKDRRLELTKQMLIETDLPLRDVAAHMGYADQATFTESFKRDAGTPPGRFRRQFSSKTSSTRTTPFNEGS